MIKWSNQFFLISLKKKKKKTNESDSPSGEIFLCNCCHQNTADVILLDIRSRTCSEYQTTVCLRQQKIMITNAVINNEIQELLIFHKKSATFLYACNIAQIEQFWEKIKQGKRQLFYLMTGSEKESYKSKLPNYYKCQTKIESFKVSNDLCHLSRKKKKKNKTENLPLSTDVLNQCHTCDYNFILICWKKGKSRRLGKFKNTLCYHKLTVD